MDRFNRLCRKSFNVLLLTLLGSISELSAADEQLFNAYPGVYDAKLVRVDTANSIYLMVNVWEGFPKEMRITLKGVTVPVAGPNSKLCEIELADRALQFSKDFFDNASLIKVKDIEMEQTDQEDGYSTISTNQGELGRALLNEGLARPSATPDSVPWC